MPTRMESVREAFRRINAYQGTDITAELAEVDVALAADGVAVSESVGLGPMAYALDPEVEASWVAGQLREIAAANPKGMTAIAVVEAWLWRAKKILRRYDLTADLTSQDS